MLIDVVGFTLHTLKITLQVQLTNCATQYPNITQLIRRKINLGQEISGLRLRNRDQIRVKDKNLATDKTAIYLLNLLMS